MENISCSWIKGLNFKIILPKLTHSFRATSINISAMYFTETNSSSQCPSGNAKNSEQPKQSWKRTKLKDLYFLIAKLTPKKQSEDWSTVIKIGIQVNKIELRVQNKTVMEDKQTKISIISLYLQCQYNLKRKE